MEFDFKRTIDPDSFIGNVSFTSADIDAAFTNQADADEQLWYDWFSPTFGTKPVSEQLSITQRVAVLVEQAQARNMSFSGGTVVDKG